MMSSELQSRGNFASTAGIAALKLCPEMCFASPPKWGVSRLANVTLKPLLVKFFPDPKLNTGESGLYSLSEALSALSALTGHTF